MSTVSRSIWKAAGSPDSSGSARGVCRACGLESSGITFARWVKPTFTDHDKLVPGEIVCQACEFCFSDQNEQLAKLLGKSEPQRMRNYSHFVLRGQWIPLSKGNKRRMRTILTGSPEAAVIADSGQKHIIFRATLGWWQFEETGNRPFADSLSTLLAVIEPAYQAGISKTELESGRYIQRRILDFGIENWRRVESIVGPLRGAIQLQLALFLAQKEENDGS